MRNVYPRDESLNIISKKSTEWFCVFSPFQSFYVFLISLVKAGLRSHSWGEFQLLQEPCVLQEVEDLELFLLFRSVSGAWSKQSLLSFICVYVWSFCLSPDTTRSGARQNLFYVWYFPAIDFRLPLDILNCETHFFNRHPKGLFMTYSPQSCP